MNQRESLRDHISKQNISEKEKNDLLNLFDVLEEMQSENLLLISTMILAIIGKRIAGERKDAT